MTTRKKTVSIKVDATMYSAAKIALAARGTDIDAWVNLQLRTFARSTKIMFDLKDAMPMGKYLGANIEEIIRVDPAYMRWVLEQDFKKYKFTPAVIALISELTGDEFNQDTYGDMN